MKYCHACGQAIDDDTLFCPYCGTKQEPMTASEPASYSEPEPYEEPEPCEEPETAQPYAADDFDSDSYDADPYAAGDDENGYGDDENAYGEEEAWSEAPAKPAKKKKKGSRKGKKTALTLGLVIGGVVLVAAAAVLLFLTGAIGSLLPHSKAKLKLAELNLFKDMAAVADTELGDAKKLDMSYTLSMKAVTADTRYSSSDTADVINKLKLSGGVESDGKSMKLRATADFKGNELLDVLYFLDQDKMSLYMSPVSDDFYTCKLEDLVRLTGGDADDLPDTDKREKNGRFKDLFDFRMKISKGKTVALFDDEKTVKGVAVYQISPTEKEWKKMMTDVLDSVVYKGSYFRSYLELLAEVEGGRMDADDMLDELRDAIDEFAEKLADQDVTIEGYMKGNTIIRQAVRFGEDGASVGYEALASGKESRFFVYYSEEEGDVEPLFDFQSTQSGRTLEFEATIHSGRDKYRISGSGINTKKVSTLGIPQGEYSISIEGNRIELNVAPEGKGMNHELRIRFNQDNRYRAFDSFSATLYTEKGTTINKPKGVETVDLSDYSEAEFQKLVQKLSNKLMNIAQKVVD